MLIQQQVLRRFAKTLIEHTGSTDKEAQIVSDHLVEANLSGHDSHGVCMLPAYVENYKNDRLRSNTQALCVKDDGAILMFDGGLGYGQRVALDAMQAAIERCQDTGVVLMTLRNAHHIGRIGYYGEYSTQHGLASLHFVNVQDHDPWVVPFGGAVARYGTNPCCIALPGSQQSKPCVLDFATSRIAVGKVRVAQLKNESLPVGMLVDSEGNSRIDPASLLDDPRQSSLLPFGEHKGSGLALFCELLGGILSGGGTIQPDQPRQGGIINNMFTIVFDPARLVEQDWLHSELDALLAYVKSDPTVLVAGEPERLARAQRSQTGIEIDPNSWDELVLAAAALGISRDQCEQLADLAT